MEKGKMNIQGYYPEEMEIQEIREKEKGIEIQIKSRSKGSKCPHCGSITMKRSATYRRRAQDLPILGKSVMLDINAYEYRCVECGHSVNESFEGFLLPRSRLTERCRNFIVQLALGTNCESASRILKEIGIEYSGNSIVRLLVRRLEEMPEPKAGSMVGVDDFAFKKGHIYGTIIVDGDTHRPVAVLEGRDGKTLREWLAKNRHINLVTRDRASEYARAIQEVLPEAMQAADRFHLYENMYEAVKKALNSTIPSAVPSEPAEELSSEERDKKRGSKSG